MTADVLLIFECDDCRLEFGVKARTISRRSGEDWCCPLCRSNRHKLFVEVVDDGAD